MVSQRQQLANERLEFALTVIMEQEVDSVITTALRDNGYTDIRLLMSMRAKDLDELSYTLPDSTQRILNLGEKGMIRALLSFLGQYFEKGNMIAEKWDELANADNFDEYRTSTAFQNLNFDKKAEPPKTNTNSSSSTTNTKSDRTPADEFKRGIRRDTNAFSVLKDVKHFDEWNRSTIAQARSQGLGDILNPTFKPEETDTDAVDLFREKQAFMYSVFHKTLLTDTGRELVRHHEKKFDAQLKRYTRVS